jgi:hypothetical protein
LAEPLQIVFGHVKPECSHLDWRNYSLAEQEREIGKYLLADRNKGFDLAEAPLTRLALIRTGDEKHVFIWSGHHLQIDGWSWPIVLGEVSKRYSEWIRGNDSEWHPAPLYRSYMEWLSHQNPSDEKQFWEEHLGEVQAPTPLPEEPEGISDEDQLSEELILLNSDLSTQLQHLARSHQLTVNILMRGAWALLLSHYSGHEEVVLGASFSGRPAELSGVESIVGPFVNNLPVRVNVSSKDSLLTWLSNLQSQQFELSRHDHSSISQIQEWSKVPLRTRLFNSLFVFQNYLVDPSSYRLNDRAELSILSAPERTNYLITLLIVPVKDQFSVKMIYRSERFARTTIRTILKDFEGALKEFTTSPGQTLSHVFSILSPLAAKELPRKREASRTQFVAPKSELEQTIASIWQEAFLLDKVGLYDNFFDLGGHSLLMIKVHARLVEKLKMDLSIIKMFQYPTVSSLAKYLSKESSESSYDKIQERAQKQREALVRQRKSIRRN